MYLKGQAAGMNNGRTKIEKTRTGRIELFYNKSRYEVVVIRNRQKIVAYGPLISSHLMFMPTFDSEKRTCYRSLINTAIGGESSHCRGRIGLLAGPFLWKSVCFVESSLYASP